MSKVDDAYAAAFVDGEGHISIRINGYPTVQVTNSDLPVLQWFRAWARVGNITTIASSARSGQYYQWKVSGANAQSVLRRILPYLKIEDKVQRVHYALAWTLRSRGVPEGFKLGGPVSKYIPVGTDLHGKCQVRV